MYIHPFIRYAGGKKQLLNTIREFYPSKFNKYVEPFVGGGAVLFDILNNYNVPTIINDLNPALINVYKTVQNNSVELCKLLTSYEEEYNCLEERKTYYLEKRNKYNMFLQENKYDTECASLMIFLNRVCFNGLYRVNSKGLFNVPLDINKTARFDKENILNSSLLLKDTMIMNNDYKAVEEYIDDGTFVYLDPPYRPLKKTSTKSFYTNAFFDDEKQIELARFVRRIVDKGAYVLLSNSDPKNTNPDDDFFDDLYRGFEIHRVEAPRYINSKSNGRGKIKEILVVAHK